MLQGAFTAMVTPFRDGGLDESQLAKNVAFQIEQGIDGLVPVGTTGESPTLSHDEHRRVVERTVEAAAGKVKVVAGTGSNATQEALELTRHAKQAGVDAALMVNPYYNKPSQEGLYRHFMTVADQVDLPIVLYNIPGRTAIQLTAETVARLARHDNIVAIKEATGSMDMASEIAMRCEGQQMTILSGDDSLTLPLMSIGAKGVISVVSNILPAKVKAMVDAALKGNFVEARQQHAKLFPLFRGMLSLDVNPVPIKTAMRLLSQDTGELRLPLCEMSDDASAALEKVLREAALL
ncbi:4-hydroxy-tetrahydrodipicolinate synthase [Phycisphaerales bacterium AB-hyl4]|uniref:4-hydroxy-tetrahydrodipicolinate synthase n=1 Tax=Natronomicrosphaera hydrolytica TaxID=3242702 RepID=A0ABV4U1A3_9BACT